MVTRSSVLGRMRLVVAAAAIAVIGVSVVPAGAAQAATTIPSKSISITAPGSSKNIARATSGNVVTAVTDARTWANMKSKSSKSIVLTFKNTGKKNVILSTDGVGLKVLPGTGKISDHGIVLSKVATTTLKPGKTAYALVNVVAPKGGTKTGLKVDVRYRVR